MGIKHVLDPLNFCFFVCFSSFWFWSRPVSCSSEQDQLQSASFVVSSFKYPEAELKHYQWRYIRAELPPWFSSMSMDLTTNAKFGKESSKKIPKSLLPLICFRVGSPPLPDVSNSSWDHSVSDFFFNGSIVDKLNLLGMEQCLIFQKSITATLTNEQISPGALYIGFFNGIGSVRTQSKMISRGPAYKVSANITVYGCMTITEWGPYCNQTIDLLSCAQSNLYKHPRELLNVQVGSRECYLNNYYLSSNPMFNMSRNDNFSAIIEDTESPLKQQHALLSTENVTICGNSYESVCLGHGELKIYSLEILSMSSLVKITAQSIRINQTFSSNTEFNRSNNGTENEGQMLVTCYARHGAIPSKALHDCSADISRFPLIIDLPKLGRWYIAILVTNQTEVDGLPETKHIETKLCFSLEWKLHICPLGKAGENCTWERHMLQRILKKSSSVPFQSYYLPIGQKVSMGSTDFPLQPLLSNTSSEGKLGDAWTYFLLDVPHGAAGGHIHVQLKLEATINYEIYAKYGGVPSIDTWDYHANGMSINQSSTFIMLNDSSAEKLEFYILYAREGIWSFGIKHSIGSPWTHQSTISLALVGCPKRCSGHGTCHSALDESGLTLYSYCFCDRNHGGFDCSIELVSHEGHIWQSISLIASNAAAILPGFWALRQKAFAEWVLFTSSGISSALYHSCDVGTWCALSFHVLQFMDFWLSFMAVVSTFIYMASIDEVLKRAIHTGVSILTALMAATGPTRSANIILVVTLGTLGLLVGWAIEFSTAHIMTYQSQRFNLNLLERWENIKRCLNNLIVALHKRFHWYFIFMGFVGLSVAAMSWKLETSQSYWIWHSIWHVSIYTASFFFLCSVNNSRSYLEADYELTSQNPSSSRGE